MPCLYSVCWKPDNTIIIALENRDYHVNLGTAILFWVSALETLCTPGYQGKMAQKLLSSIVHGKQDLETWTQRSMLIELGVLIQWNSNPAMKTTSSSREYMDKSHGCVER